MSDIIQMFLSTCNDILFISSISCAGEGNAFGKKWLFVMLCLNGRFLMAVS